MHSEHAIVKPGGTGTPRLVISARLAPLPPSTAFMSLVPSAAPLPKKYTLRGGGAGRAGRGGGAAVASGGGEASIMVIGERTSASAGGTMGPDGTRAAEWYPDHQSPWAIRRFSFRAGRSRPPAFARPMPPHEADAAVSASAAAAELVGVGGRGGRVVP